MLIGNICIWKSVLKAILLSVAWVKSDEIFKMLPTVFQLFR